jgi:predicted phage tail protein
MSDPTAIRADDTDEMDTTQMDDTMIHTTELETPPSAAPVDRPRVRWAGIVWGVAFAAAAAGGVVLTRSPAAYGTLVGWVAAPSIPALVAAALLTVGVLILIAGVVGLLRRGQRLLSARRTESAGAPAPAEPSERHTA